MYLAVAECWLMASGCGLALPLLSLLMLLSVVRIVVLSSILYPLQDEPVLTDVVSTVQSMGTCTEKTDYQSAGFWRGSASKTSAIRYSQRTLVTNFEFLLGERHGHIQGTICHQYTRCQAHRLPMTSCCSIVFIHKSWEKKRAVHEIDYKREEFAEYHHLFSGLKRDKAGFF